MAKIFFLTLLVFVPGIVYGFVASDFTVNSHSTYAIPPGTTRVLILDLTLPEALESIKIKNAGTVQSTDMSKISVFGDGDSAGWDGDETELTLKSSAPFWETWLSGFSRTRIFITVDIKSTAVSERTIKPQLEIDSLKFTSGATGPTDREVTGFERMILAGASIPAVPVTPLAGTAEAISTSTIRWYFTDLSNNEFGFKILDGNSNIVVKKEQADLTYLDETGLQPDTEYADRQVIAFNDIGESLGSPLAVFPAARTLAEEAEVETIEEETETEEVRPPEEVAPQPVEEIEEPVEPSLLETIQQKIAEIQQKINELLKQLNELIGQQAASIWQAFQRFFQSLFGR